MIMMGSKENTMQIHAPITSFLICISLVVNLIFLASLKANKPKMNNNDKIQVYKTIMVILATITCIPMELWIMQPEHATEIACAFKDVLQALLLDSFPVNISAVAIIRFRLAVCRGDANLLVSRAFFIFMILGCFLFSLFVAVLNVFLVVIFPGNVHYNQSRNEVIYCYQVHHISQNYLHILSIFLMYVIPSFLVTILYIAIIQISSVSITRVQQFRQSELQHSIVTSRHSILPFYTSPNRVSATDSDVETRNSKIWKSVGTVVAFFLVVTIPVSFIEIYLSVTEPNADLNIALLYLKTFTCISHAVGEGTLNFEKRRRTKLFFEKYFIPASSSQTATRRLSHDGWNVIPAPIFRVASQLSTVNEVTTPSQQSLNTIKNEEENTNVKCDSEIPDFCNTPHVAEIEEIHRTHLNSVPLPEIEERYHKMSIASLISPRKLSRCRISSSFLNCNLQPLQSRRITSLNLSPGPKLQLKRQNSIDFICETPLSDSVFTFPDPPLELIQIPVRPMRISNSLPSEILLTTGPRTLPITSSDFEDQLSPADTEGVQKVCESIRTLSVLSDNM